MTEVQRVADAILRELRQQCDGSMSGLLFSISDDDLTRVGIDGYVNLLEIARVAIEAANNR